MIILPIHQRNDHNDIVHLRESAQSSSDHFVTFSFSLDHDQLRAPIAPLLAFSGEILGKILMEDPLQIKMSTQLKNPCDSITNLDQNRKNRLILLAGQISPAFRRPKFSRLSKKSIHLTISYRYPIVF